jgi:hypothetical protein
MHSDEHSPDIDYSISRYFAISGNFATGFDCGELYRYSRWGWGGAN